MVTATINTDAKQAQDARKHARKYVLELKKTGILPEIRGDFGREWDSFIDMNIERLFLRMRGTEDEKAKKIGDVVESLCALNKDFKELLYPTQGENARIHIADTGEAPPFNFALPPTNLNNSFLVRFVRVRIELESQASQV